jgi:membrane protease YdiL (CAAX protease family)
MLSNFINALVQVALFSLIPFIWWLVTARKNENFFHWIGLKRPVLSNARLFAIVVLAYAVVTVLSQALNGVLFNRSVTASAQFSEFSVSQLVNGLVYGLVQTGLAEEILFRGFLMKRLGKQFGFAIGNALQALIFGLLHGVLFYTVGGVSMLGVVIITVVSAAGGWLFGYVNEKLSGGSIMPSYLMHGLGNFLVALFGMLGLI